MPGTLRHLSGRFFDVLSAKPLDSAERATVESWLAPELSDIFFSQPSPDQRHGYAAGLFVLEAGAEPEVVTAALLHDTGKRHSGLGVMGRVFASLLIKWRLPLPPRVRSYRDHGLLAAGELSSAGAPSLAIDYALHHHHSRPASIPAATWELLELADRPKAVKWARSGISSADT